MNKPELIRTIREAHQRVVGAIEHVPDERLLEPAMDDWTGKDLLAHMAWWHDHSVLVIEGLRAGRQPYDGTDPANASSIVLTTITDVTTLAVFLGLATWLV